MWGGLIVERAWRSEASPKNSVEITLRYGQMPPLHVHPEDEKLSVLEGRLTVFAGGRQLELGAGESWVAPSGVPHTYGAATGSARLPGSTCSASPAHSPSGCVAPP